MPRNRKPGQGHRYGGGGGGIDLGGLLLAMYGGVEANPAAAEAATVLNDPTLATGMDPRTKALFQKDAANVVKPRTAFDRAEAGRINADYATDELSANNQAMRELMVREKSIPLNLREEEGRSKIAVDEHAKKGKIDLENETSLKRIALELGISEEKAKAAINELSANNQAARELMVREKSIPLNLRQKQGETDIETKAHKEKGTFDSGLRSKEAQEKSKLNIDEDTARSINQVLVANGIAPNGFDIRRYMEEVNPERFKEAQSGIQTRTSANKAQAADIDRDQQIKGGTFADTLATAQTQAKGNRQLAEGETQQIPAVLDYKKIKREQDLKQGEADMTRGRFMGVGNSLLDVYSDPVKSVFTEPTAMEKLQQGGLQTRTTGSAPVVSSPATAGPTNEMVEIEIDGVKLRVPRSALEAIQRSRQSAY